MTQLGSVAESMRKCADVAEHFSQVIMHLGPNAPLPPVPQFHTLPMPDPKHMSLAPPSITVSTNGKRKAQSAADGEVKKKKVRKPRDPDAPKRPPSSYLLFQNEVRQAMKQANPGMANHEILTTISQRWASMTPEEKDTYNKRQELAKAQYAEKKTAYDALRGPVAEVPSPSGEALTTSSPTVAPAVSPPLLKAVKAAEPTAVVADSPTSDESSSEDDTSDPSESSSEDAEEDEQPVQKKAKKGTASKAPPPSLKKETRKKTKN